MDDSAKTIIDSPDALEQRRGARVTISGDAQPPEGPATYQLDDTLDIEEGPLPALESGTVVEAPLAEGGMGQVFIARDAALNRELAVKVLSSGLSGAAIRARFLREAQVTAQLSHPNIIPIYALDQTRGQRPALAMKLVRGETLADYLDACRRAHAEGAVDAARYGLDARLELFLKICDAMAYSHERGVVHRDLKPENVMIGAFGEVYVMDWGAARLMEEVEDDGVSAGGRAAMLQTSTEAIIGTPLYMSPEQANYAAGAGPASDQYTLGLMLFELLTFKDPRDTDGMPFQLVMNAGKGLRRSFADVGAESTIPRDLQAIVDRATQIDEGARYPGVSAFAEDIRRFLRDEATEVYPDNALRSAWRALKRRPITALAVLVIVLTVAGVVTTWSLLSALESQRETAAQQEQAAARQQHLSALVATTTRHTQAIDRKLTQVEALIEGIAAAAVRDLELSSAAPSAAVYLPKSLKGGAPPPGTQIVPRYKQRVSFEHSVYLPAPGGDVERAKRDARRVKALDRDFRAAFLRNKSQEASASAGSQDARLISGEGVTLMWGYLGLSDGLLINYPGNENYPPDYDASKRPWYTNTSGPEPRWGMPYPDATGTGYLLPCNLELTSSAKERLGVAGLDMSMDGVIALMQIPEIENVQGTFLMGASGEVIVHSNDKGARTAVSVQGNTEKTREAVRVEGLVAHAKRGTASGFVVDGEALYVFARLTTIPWLLVVELKGADHQL